LFFRISHSNTPLFQYLLLPEVIAAPVRLAHAVADPMRWRQQLAVLDRSNLVVQQSSCKCRRAGGVVRADQMRRSRRVQPWPVIRLESKKASLHRHRQSAADRSLVECISLTVRCPTGKANASAISSGDSSARCFKRAPRCAPGARKASAHAGMRQTLGDEHVTDVRGRPL
jgi:hypothetical protein